MEGNKVLLNKPRYLAIKNNVVTVMSLARYILEINHFIQVWNKTLKFSFAKPKVTTKLQP